MLDIFDDRPEEQKIESICKALREKDKNMRRRNRHVETKRLTYWDADDFVLKHPDEVVCLNKTDGAQTDTVAIAAKRPEVQGAVNLTPNEIVDLQFVSGEMFAKIKLVNAEIGVEGITHEEDGLAEIKRYCEKMDELIVEAAKKLKEHKVKNIFEKLCEAMVGKEPQSHDRLGKRVVYFKELMTRYRADKEKYRDTLKKVGLI